MVPSEDLAIPHYGTTVDDDPIDEIGGGAVDQCSDRVSDWPNPHPREIHHNQIGPGARSQAPEVITAERLGTADRCGIEDGTRRSRLVVAVCHLPEDRGPPHLADDIERIS